MQRTPRTRKFRQAHFNFYNFTKLLLLPFILCSGITAAQVNFSASDLSGESLKDPTSLDFGPDGRLYVTEQDGDIYAYTILRNASNSYSVLATEHITLVRNIQNFNDDGSLHNPVTPERQITGILLAGTAAKPVIYVTSSDYRIGGGGGGSDDGLCTNSGIISRLVRDNGQWTKTDLVRGLPRSEENHATNGLQLDTANNILYVAQGGSTNAGSPSNNFALITEYAYSAAILTVDLTALDSMSINYDATTNSNYVYDLPTVDDPTRPNANGIDDPLAPGYNGLDINDPFGGNDGLNQAKILANSPVQIYSPGFRNIYDLVLTRAGRLYTWDNGPNGGWGGHPENEGTPAVTNNWVSGEPGSDAAGPNDAKVNNKDGLHFVTGPGYYGGHPNPIRANPTGAGLYTHDHNDGTGGTNGVFRTSYTGVDATTLPYDWPPVDPAMANPIEADYQNPGVDDQSLWTITASSNGMCEYTASNFGNALKGNLLATSWNENIYQINLNAAGSINSSSDVSSLASNFGSDPLDVTAQGDSAIFPGTIWIASYGSNKITILEPQDFAPCNGTDDSGIDEDFDGYSNADEIDNASDPCNGSSLPPDNDKTIIASFKVSDLNDPDDDDDGLLDTVDPYAWDAANGANTTSPLNYTLLNGDPGTGFYGLGFTGLMTNGIDNYTSLIQDEDNSSTEIIAGGAVGLLTFNDQAAGSPVGSQNDLKNAFQFGLAIDDNTAAIRVDVRLLGPLFQGNPQGDQFQGFFIGNGDQDNFLMMTVAANNGTPVVEFTEEMNGLTTTWTESVPGIENASETSLLMVIDPGTGEVQARVDTGTGAFDVGSLLTLSGSLLSTLQGPDALAIGVAAGRSDATPLFNATWDFIKVEWLVNPMGNWSFVHNGNTCAPMGSPGSCPQGRHEASYAQIGDKFILLGGKEHGSNVNIYDPAANSWTVGASPDVNIHHFQAVEYEGLLYMLGAMSGKFPNEQGLPSIWIYDPHNDEWCEGPPMPQNRIRGSAGCVVYNDKLYLVAGIINGHTSGWVPWFDVFDPATNSWTTLPDAPHSRDHFHAAIVNDKLYALAGRRSGSLGTFNDTEADVDVYDFNTGSWSTLPNTLPTERAGNTVAVLGDEILVIGGEKYNGDAEATTEALDVNTNNWRALADMNDGRHGTQAIVNNGGVYIASGSPVRGSGQLLSQEVFSFGTTQSPILNAITPGQITASAGNIKFPVVNGGGQASKTFTISNVGGNQGIIVKDVAFEDGSGLSYSTNPSLPYHLSPGENFDITITYAPAVTGLPDDLMTVLHTGLTPFTQVIISDPSCPSVSLGQDQVICPNEQLSFTAGTFLDSAVWYVNNQVVASGVHTYNHTTTGHDVLRVVVFPDSSGCPILYDTITLKHSSAYLVETAGPIIAPFTDGYVIDLKAVGDFSLVAEPCPASAESVVFNLNGSDIATESQPPYAINGDDVTTFDPWLVDTGSHILIIKAFSGNGGNGTPYPADTFHFSVVDSLPSVDCEGIKGGTAMYDDCGICTGGSTGLIPNADKDSCGVCFGGNTAKDCNGDCFGTAFIDSCGDCAGGSTGLVPNSGCNVDCNGDINGSAYYDDCNICVDGNTGKIANTDKDSCGVCFGNNSQKDCHGDCFGTAFIDDCGVCAGGSTGNIANTTCTPPCVPLQITGFTLVYDDLGGDIGPLVNGDILVKSVIGGFSIRAEVCSTSAIGSVVFNVNGNNVQTEGVAPYAIAGDNSSGYYDWNPAEGTYTLIGTPYYNGGGNGTAGIADTITFTVLNDPPPTDCHGDTSGTASVDACGVCAGGATGKTPNATCTDCNGEPNGTASFDACGICTGGSTGVIPNASCTDCNGDLFGLAVIDACGDCAGGNTTLVPNAACTDCNGDINGTAVVDSCGDCVLGATGAAFNSGCNIDCNGVVDGTALLDSCGVCAGGNTGVTPNTVCLDCHGDLNGTAFFDACGDCAGGNTALVPNAACTDCHGDVNGTAFTDTCGVCAGGNTGTVPDQSCATCVQLEVVSLTLMQAGSGGPIRQLLNGDVIYKSTTGPFSVRADVCDQPVGSVVFNVNGNNIQTESVFPYAINGDGGGSFNQWDPAPGNYIITAMPYSNNGGNGTAGIAETVTITVMNDPPPTDCHGDTNGTASVDACGVCAGGATGKTPNATCTDCNGEPNGTASFDACGICTGGSTGVIPNASCTDCNGDLFGLAAIDACGDCAGGNTTLVPNAACTDCNGDINGTAVVDSCGDCVLGATGAAFNSGCNIDCNGVVDGTALLDSCGVCAGGNTGVTPNTVCLDCHGDLNGTAFFDACGDCAGGNTALVPNAACTDCHGDVNGTAFTDTCGVCAGGGTGVVPGLSCAPCSGNEVRVLVLIDASTKADVRAMANGDTIYRSLLPLFSVRADVCVSSATESVVFDLNGSSIRTESVEPYIVNGDVAGNYTPWDPGNGNHTLTAIPFDNNGGNGSMGIAKAVNFWVVDGPPPADCAGIVGGSAFFDACGDCAGGSTGTVPNSSCTDCNGEVNGTALVDTCGICTGGSTGVIPNASCTDCNGDLFGLAVIDACGDCAGGNTTLVPNAACTDCNGDINGTAVVDSCGDCVLGATGAAFNSGCNIDCNGVVDGTALLDSCGVCAGGNTGVTPNTVCLDCHGDLNGTAFFDACGDCAGGNTALVPNAACTDCHGDVNGTAFTDTCGVCAGGNTGTVPDQSCATCVQLEVVSLTLMQAGSGGPIRQLLNGDVIYKSTTGPFSVRADVCDQPVGSVVFNVNGNNIQTESVFPYAINGDGGGSFNQWDPAPGNYIITAMPYSNNGGNGTAGIAETVTITVMNDPPPTDCHGDTNGTASVDACGVCAGGATGKTPNATCTDCNGEPNGTASFDACGICTGGSTGVIPNASCTDCNGDLFGLAAIDACGDCAGGNTTLVPNAACTDCNGDINGTAVVDSCGDCVLGATGAAFNSGCNIDCNGVVDGTALLDSCGVCAGGNTGVTPNTVCLDCHGDLNGTAFFDACGDCAGGNTALVPNAACTDCHGDVNGTAFTDTCGVCAGGNTGTVPNSCGGCTDNEVVSLILINANTGVDIGAITIGDTIDKSQLPEFSMRAEVCTPSAVGSVEFELNGNNIRTENVAPYSINGDNSGNYDPWDPGIGSHTVSAIPYSGNNGSGIMGRSKTVNFWVIDGPPPTDCNGVIYGSAYYDACGDCVGGSTGLTPCATSAGCDEFIEGGGLVVVEVESEPKANNNWYEGTGTINGLTVDPPSGSYYMWKVNCVSGTDPNYDYSSCGGTDGGNSGNAMTYEIYISYPGRYRFQMRSWQPGIKLSNHGASTENNDFWLQLPDGGGIKKKSSTEISIGSSEWVKVYQNSTWNWVWKTSTVDNSPHDIFVDFPTAGTYTVKIGARSKLMGLDRFVLYRSENASGNVSEAMATTAMPPESPRGSCASVTYNRDHNNQGQTQQQQSNRATGVALIENSPVPQQFNLRVYPNPTTGALQVEFEPAEARAELMLYDATGKLLQRFPAVQGVLHLDLSHYAEGLYWLKMCSDGEVITKRIMKN